MAADNPRAAILVIGDELLLGETIDSNSAFICQRLTARGVEVRRVVSVPDESDEIVRELNRLRAEDYDFILTSGGIGPTPDDITRQAVARALGVDLLLNQTAVRRYEELRGSPMNEKQLEMCRLPGGAEPLLQRAAVHPGLRWLTSSYCLGCRQC